MSSLPFDFGEFSFLNLGVTINLPQELGRLIPHILELLSLEAHPSPDERLLYVDRLLCQEKEEDARFIIMGYITAISHELKHFHDHLASPYGASLITQYVLAASYLLPLMHLLRNEQAIAVPLQDWEHLTDDRYNMYYGLSKNIHFNRHPPHSALDLARRLKRMLAKAKAWQNAPLDSDESKSPITTRHLLEASAVEAQATGILDAFGPNQLIAFSNYLRHIDTDNLYTRLWGVWAELAHLIDAPQFSPSSTVRNALVFYALCGTTHSDAGDNTAHPVKRFFALLGAIAVQRHMPNDNTIMDFLNNFAKTYGLPTLKESLIESVATAQQFSKAMRQINYMNLKSEQDDLLDAYDNWISAQEYMVSRILKNPIDYFNPEKYINEPDWVGAPFFLSTSAPIFTQGDSPDPTVKKWLEYGKKWLERGWTPVGGILRGTIATYNLILSPEFTVGKPILSEKSARTLSHYFFLTSMLCTHDLDTFQRSLASQVMQSTGIKVFLLP